MSDSLRPYSLQPARLLCPWNSPGENTGTGCHFLLQEIFLTQGSNPRLLRYQADSLPLSHLGRPMGPLQNIRCLAEALKRNKIKFDSATGDQCEVLHLLIDPEQLGTPVLASDVCSLAGMRLYVPFLLDPDLCDFSFYFCDFLQYKIKVREHILPHKDMIKAVCGVTFSLTFLFAYPFFLPIELVCHQLIGKHIFLV